MGRFATLPPLRNGCAIDACGAAPRRCRKPAAFTGRLRQYGARQHRSAKFAGGLLPSRQFLPIGVRRTARAAARATAKPAVAWPQRVRFMLVPRGATGCTIAECCLITYF